MHGVNVRLCEPTTHTHISGQSPISKEDASEVSGDLMLLRVQVRINVVLEDKI